MGSGKSAHQVERLSPSHWPGLRRIKQFFRALFARVKAQEIEQVKSELTPEQFDLFEGMQRSDQRHSLDVWNTLRGAGYDDPYLLQAALLHDIGKAATRLSVWHRVAFVLTARFTPDWLTRQANEEQGTGMLHHTWWHTLCKTWCQAPLTVYAQHAQRSADWAAQAGSDPRVVACIRSHHKPGSDQRSVALYWADEQH